jgi:hypothetical protein
LNSEPAKHVSIRDFHRHISSQSSFQSVSLHFLDKVDQFKEFLKFCKSSGKFQSHGNCAENMCNGFCFFWQRTFFGQGRIAQKETQGGMKGGLKNVYFLGTSSMDGPLSLLITLVNFKNLFTCNTY